MLSSYSGYLQAYFGGSLRALFPKVHGVSPMALLRAEVLPLQRQQEESLQGTAWFSKEEWTAARSTGSLQQAV